MGIEKVLNDVITFVFSYVGDTNDWVTVKKEILKNLPSRYRTLFSTRDPITKKQRMNDFEKFMMKKWFKITGNKLIFMNHDEK